MNNTVVIHQPDFAPYIGFFQRLVNADLFIILDNVQFSNDGWTHRDKIRTREGSKWITNSVKKTSLNSLINEISYFESDWRIKNLNLIKENYRKAKFFKFFFPFLEDLYYLESQSLLEFNMFWINSFCDLLDLKIDIVYASQLNVSGAKNELLINLLRSVNASSYLSGDGAKAYLDEGIFTANNINLIWQNYNHPIYEQQFDKFIPYLSIIDCLLNCGINETKNLIINK